MIKRIFRLFLFIILITPITAFAVYEGDFIDGDVTIAGTSTNRIKRTDKSSYSIHNMYYTHDGDDTKYLAFCVEPGVNANVKSHGGVNGVHCRPLWINKDMYAGLRGFLRATGIDRLSYEEYYAKYENNKDYLEMIEFYIKLIGTEQFQHGTNRNYNDPRYVYGWNRNMEAFVSTYNHFNDVTPTVDGYKFNYGKYDANSYLYYYDSKDNTISEGYFWDDFSHKRSDYVPNSTNISKYGANNVISKIYNAHNNNIYFDGTTMDTSTYDYDPEKLSEGLETNDTTAVPVDDNENIKRGSKYKVSMMDTPELQRLKEKYEEAKSKYEYYYNAGIVDLANQMKAQAEKLQKKINQYTEYWFQVEVIDGGNTSKPEVEYKTSKYTTVEFTSWNKSTGKGVLKVVKKKASATCSLAFSLIDTGSTSSDSVRATYICTKNEVGQHFLTFLPIDGVKDKFTFSYACDNTEFEGLEDDPTEPVTCGTVNQPFDPVDTDLHNCCLEDKDSTIRQEALDELFCPLSTEVLNVDGAQPKENADEYLVSENLAFCSLYCGSTIKYSLPKPTRAVADRTFSLGKNKSGTAGVLYKEYKRCRSIIRFDEWLKSFENSVNSAVSSYNSYQFNMGKVEAWKKAVANAGTETLNYYVSCTNTFYLSSFTESWTETETVEKTCGRRDTPDDDGKCWKDVEVTKSKVVSDASVSQTHSDTYTTSVTKYDVTTYANIVKFPKLKKNLSEYTSIQIDYDKMQSVKDEGYSGIFINLTQKNNADSTAESKARGQCSLMDSEAALSSYSCPTDHTCSLNGGSWGTPSTYKYVSTYTAVDPDEQIKSFESSANTSRISYNSSVKSMESLKNGLIACGGEVDSSGHRDDSAIINRIKFDEDDYPNMQFTYKVAYTDDFSNHYDQEIEIPFKRTCVEEYATSFSEKIPTDLDWLEKWDIQGYKNVGRNDYDSGTYKSGFMNVMLNKTIPADDSLCNSSNPTAGCNTLETSSEAASHHKENFSADKKFVTDAVTKLTCKWEEETKTEYTIVPSGSILKNFCVDGNCDYETPNSGIEMSKTRIQQGTRLLYKTHAMGAFETYFTLSNVAGGDLDDALSDNGHTCSDLNTNLYLTYNDKRPNASCMLYVEQEEMILLDCSGTFTLASDVTRDCDSTKKTAMLEYKEVDPIDLFPNDVTYGWNWKSTTEGQTTMEYIQSTAQDYKTYAPENLTYSFILEPSDLAAIRQYNKSRIPFGGYSDFEMICEENSLGAAVKCKSVFLNAISNISAANGLSLDTFNGNITDVRNHWADI